VFVVVVQLSFDSHNRVQYKRRKQKKNEMEKTEKKTTRFHCTVHSLSHIPLFCNQRLGNC